MGGEIVGLCSQTQKEADQAQEGAQVVRGAVGAHVLVVLHGHRLLLRLRQRHLHCLLLQHGNARGLRALHHIEPDRPGTTTKRFMNLVVNEITCYHPCLGLRSTARC